MGDRANVYIRDGRDQVCLYTHWGGAELPDVVREALKRGTDRWHDAPYLARVVLCEMVKDDPLANTGYGIWNRPCDNQNQLIVLDTQKQEVQFYNRDHDEARDEVYLLKRVSFSDYIRSTDGYFTGGKGRYE